MFGENGPALEFGVVLGAPSQIFAVVTDADVGEENLQELRGEQSLKMTVTIKNAQRRVRLFRIPAGYSIPHVQLAPGLTVLGDDDLVVMPSGGGDTKCRFVRERAIGEIAFAAAPQWLIDQITQVANNGSLRRRRSSAGPKKTAMESQRTAEASVTPPPGRNQSLARFGRPPTRVQSRADFATAIQALKKLMTKPSQEFVGLIEPLDLEIVGNFLKQIAAAAEIQLHSPR